MAERRLDRELMRQSNAKLVLMTLLTSKQATKPMLAEATGISLMSIGRICDELMSDGLIRFTEAPAASTRTGGRPPKYLTMNAERLLCCGVQISGRMLHMGIVGPLGKVVDKQSHAFPAERDYVPDQVLPWAARLLQGFVARWRGHGLLSNIGIVVSGVVDVERGVLQYSANLHWQQSAIADAFKQLMPEFNFYLENDTKALAVAEYQCGANAGTSNLTVLSLGDGVGSAAIVNGRLFRAQSNIAGEIGHISLNPGGKVCTCGQTGCLQTYLARNVILNEAQMIHPGITATELLSRAERKEAFASALVQQALNYACIAINLLANMYAPDVIVLSGSTIWDSPAIRDMIERASVKRLHPVLAHSFKLAFDSFGPNAYVIGGAAVAFSKVVESLSFDHVL